MIIPQSVQLLGTTVPVEWVDSFTGKDKHALGVATHSNKTIELARYCRKRPVPLQVQEHTFFHELLHQILNSAGYTDINDDEQFVDVVSGLLHQALAPHMK